jgi:hypothetical protein
MLENPVELRLLVESRVGILFLRGEDIRPHEIVRVLLNRWNWLQLVASTVERPFCYLVGTRGLRKTTICAKDHGSCG